MNKLASSALFLISTFALAVSAAAAQTQTGEILGKVVDSTGAVLPGVTVTITSPALITSQTGVTTQTGAYRFAGVPIGTYDVIFELTGFKKVIRQGVRVETAFTAEINTQLEVSTVQETVTVSGESPVVDTRSTTIGTTFNKEVMESIPSARDPWVMLEMVPGMVMDRQNVGGSESGQQSGFLVHGSSSNQMWNLDGATVTDMASNSSPGYYDFDSFEEIQIQTGGNDASVDAGGVNINIVTKSGSNAFKGSARFFGIDDSFQSDNISSELAARGAGFGNPIKSIYDYGFEVGGPILRNKAWFWGGYGRQDIKVGVVGFVRPGGDPNNKDDLEIDETNLPNINAKINYQWRQGQKSGFLYSQSDKSRNARGAGPLRPPETTVRQTSPGGLYKGEHQWIVNDRVMVEGRFVYNDSGFLLNFHEDSLATVQPTFDIVTEMNGRSGTLSDNIRPTTEARVDGTWFLSNLFGGDHSTKFGVRYRHTPYETITQTGGGATARFRAGLPAEANITRDGDVYRDMWEYSAYLNDSFKKGRMTLNLGVRADYQDDKALATNITANPILPDLLPALSFSGADSGVTYFDVSPRVGLTYDLRGDGKTVAKANWATYYGLGIYTATTMSPTGQTTLRFPWQDLNGDLFVQRNELTLFRADGSLNTLVAPTSNYDPLDPTAVRSSRTVDPDLINDRTREFVVGIEHELMNNFGAGVNYIWRRYDNTTWTPRVGLSAADYRPVAATFACGNASCDEPSYTVTYSELLPGKTLPTPSVLTNTGEYRAYQGVELTARKRFSNRWLMNGSFVWNDTTRHFSPDDTSFQDPTNVELEDGFQAGTLNVRWVGKLNGMYALPWGMSVAGFFNTRQGFPLLKTVQTVTRPGGSGRADVRTAGFATERLPDLYVIDARVDKTFRFRNTRLVASIDAFNVGNASTVLNTVERQNSPTANNVEEVIAPRVFRFGLKYSF